MSMMLIGVLCAFPSYSMENGAAGGMDWASMAKAFGEVAKVVGDAAHKTTKVVVDAGRDAARATDRFIGDQLERMREAERQKRLELQHEINRLETTIADIDNQLANPHLSDNRRTVLDRQRLETQTAKTQKEKELHAATEAAARLQEEFVKTAGEIGKNGAAAFKEAITNLTPNTTKIREATINAQTQQQTALVINQRWIKFLSNPAVLGGITAAIVGTYYGLKFTYQVVEDWYKVPDLADKTTLVGPATQLWRFIFDTEVFNTTLDDVVLNPALTEKFKNYVESTRNIIENGGHLRHLLLPGPPGTGKTTLGLAIAGELGIDAVYFNAGKLRNCPLDISLRRLDQLFKNAEHSGKPLLIIIDESEVIFKHRDSKDLSEDTKMVQNAIMARLGTPQNDFIVIALTNRPQDFDPAFISRFNNRIIEILPPNLEQRTQMLELYIKKYLVNPTFKPKTTWYDSLFSDVEAIAPTIDEDVFTSERVATIAQKIEGFTGRDINNLIMDIYSEAAATADMHITKAMVDTIVDDMVKNVGKYAVPHTTAQAA